MNQVITISREYGSGGRELGVRLAKALGIPFYDKEVISMAADDMEIAEEAFRRYDEQIEIPDYLNRERSRVLSSLYEVPISDQLFVAQSNVIRRLASRGPCVVVGRCADRILENSVNLFVHAGMEQREQSVSWLPRAALTERKQSAISARLMRREGIITNIIQAVPGEGLKTTTCAWIQGWRG